MTRRKIALGALGVIAALVVPATPAAATHDAARCVDLATVSHPYVAASLCVSASGIYDPVEVNCNAIYGCWARVTAGTYSTASVEADVCFEVEGISPRFCVHTGSQTVPLVPIPPQTVCVNDSPWGPACEPHDG